MKCFMLIAVGIITRRPFFSPIRRLSAVLTFASYSLIQHLYHLFLRLKMKHILEQS